MKSYTADLTNTPSGIVPAGFVNVGPSAGHFFQGLGGGAGVAPVGGVFLTSALLHGDTAGATYGTCRVLIEWKGAIGGYMGGTTQLAGAAPGLFGYAFRAHYTPSNASFGFPRFTVDPTPGGASAVTGWGVDFDLNVGERVWLESEITPAGLWRGRAYKEHEGVPPWQWTWIAPVASQGATGIIAESAGMAFHRVEMAGDFPQVRQLGERSPLPFSSRSLLSS
jgi:hypothetical protein